MGCEREEVVALCNQYINECNMVESEKTACFGVLDRSQKYGSGGGSQTLVELLGEDGSLEAGSTLFEGPRSRRCPPKLDTSVSGEQRSTQTNKSLGN